MQIDVSEPELIKRKSSVLFAGVSVLSLVPGFILWNCSWAYAFETQHIRPVEKWTVEPASDDGDDKNDFCLARTYYNNGLIFIMARDKFGQQRIAVNFPDNRLTPGDSYPVRLSVDKNPATEYIATAAGANMLIVSFDKTNDFLKNIGRGYTMTMASSNDAVEFDLEGVGATLEKLDRCSEDELPKEEMPAPPAQDIPVAAASTEQPAPAPVKNIPAQPQPAADKKPVAAALQTKPYEPAALELPLQISDALESAGYTAKDISAPSSAATKIPLDYVWSYPNIFAGYKHIRSENTGFGNSVKSYINSMRSLCKGPFIAEASPVYTVGKRSFMHAEIGCSSAKRDSIAALLFYESLTGGTDALYLEASSDKGADVISLRNNISKNIESSFRKR